MSKLVKVEFIFRFFVILCKIGLIEVRFGLRLNVVSISVSRNNLL